MIVGSINDVRIRHDSSELVHVTRFVLFDDVTNEVLERTCNCLIDSTGDVINRTGMKYILK